MRKLLISVSLVILACGASSFAVPGIASAAPVHVAASVTHSAQNPASQGSAAVTPDAENFFVVSLKDGGGTSGYPCSGTWQVLLNSAWVGTSECSVRVWLHQNVNGTGYTECFSPHQTKAINRTYRNLQVTHNHSAC